MIIYKNAQIDCPANKLQSTKGCIGCAEYITQGTIGSYLYIKCDLSLRFLKIELGEPTHRYNDLTKELIEL